MEDADQVLEIKHVQEKHAVLNSDGVVVKRVRMMTGVVNLKVLMVNSMVKNHKLL
jgi:hypothetical protein